ncbi:hypothetical protein OE88DRAFT_147032 [Heliocybe sulcata]|uniref:Uncharacterized protein n=1 Tax=Heliocybe sulcata TaxID=5364 RepID=A0A5C3NUV8_9AGAM|nr:hypothetical protein OE88DRAFT_147032 [Heliocybe sulcata]
MRHSPAWSDSVAMKPLWSTARPPAQPLRRKGPRTNNPPQYQRITVDPSSILIHLNTDLLAKSKHTPTGMALKT